MSRDPQRRRLIDLDFLRRRKLPTATVLGHLANQDKFGLRTRARWALPFWVLPTIAVASLATLVFLCFQVADLQNHKFNPNDVVGKARAATFEVSCGGSSGAAVGINVPVPDGYKTAVFSVGHIFDECKPGDKIDVVSSGKTYAGILYKKDPVGSISDTSVSALTQYADISLIYMRVKLPTLDPAPNARVGDWVVELGNPLGEINYATSGIITKVTDSEYYTDAATNHGNSGGPLLDSQARVLGLISWSQLIAENQVDPNNRSTILDQVNGISAAKRLSNACAVIYSASPKCPFKN